MFIKLLFSLFVMGSVCAQEAKPLVGSAPVPAPVVVPNPTGTPVTNAPKSTEQFGEAKSTTDAPTEAAPTVVTEGPKVPELDPRIFLVKTEQTLYFLLEVNLGKDTSLNDLGVQDLSTITKAVLDAWKKLFLKELPEIKNLEVYDELDFKNADQHPQNIMLNFKITLSKNLKAGMGQNVDLSVSAEYVLMNLKDRGVLVSFDFPKQQRSFEKGNPKELSSKVASLIYNLVNAESQKIAETARVYLSKSVNLTEFAVDIVGAKSLIEINKVNLILNDIAKKNVNNCLVKSTIHSFDIQTAKVLVYSKCLGPEFFESLNRIGKSEFVPGVTRGFSFNLNSKSFFIND